MLTGGGGPGNVGGTGADGAAGGAGGGGSGGTIAVIGSVVDVSNLTVNTSGGANGAGIGTGQNGEFLLGTNTPIVSGFQTGVGKYLTGFGSLLSDPFIESGRDNPLIAGLQGGAQVYGLISCSATDPLRQALTAAGGELAIAEAQAPSNALVAVVRETIPAGFDQYSAYDLVIYANLTASALAGPSLGIVQGSADHTFDPALAYNSIANNTGQQTIQAIPAGGIFVTLAPTNNTLFVSAGLSGAVTDVSGQSFPRNTPYYVTLSSGTPPVSTPLPGLQAVTVSPDGLNVYALNVANNVLVVTNGGGLSQRQLVPVSGLTTASQLAFSPDGKNLYVTQPGNPSVTVFSRNPFTGALGGSIVGSGAPVQTLSATAGVSAAVAMSPDGTQVVLGGTGGLQSYVRSGTNGTLSGPGGVVQPAGLGAVTALDYSQDGHYLYAISHDNGAFVVLDASNLSAAPVATFSGQADGLVGASAIAVSHDDQYVYVTGDTGTLAVFQRDLGTNHFSLIQVLRQGSAGARALVGADGVAVSGDPSTGHPNQDKYVYVTSATGNSLAVFERLASGLLQPVQVLRGTQTLANPGAIAVGPDGTIYVTSQQGIGASTGGLGTFVYVPPIPVTAASWANGMATIAAAGTFAAGQPVTVAGITGSLVPSGYNGTFVITSVVSTNGAPTGFTYALTTNPGTATLNNATVIPQARALNVDFTTAMSTVTLVTGDSDNVIKMLHDPSVASLHVNAGSGTNTINLNDAPSTGQTPAYQAIVVRSGTGTNNVSFFADRPNHLFTFGVTAGANTGVGNTVSLDGNPANDGSDELDVALGSADDVAQVAGSHLAATATVSIDGGPGNNTLLYDAAGNAIDNGQGGNVPITPTAPLPSQASRSPR
jgi:hypothetical protein